MSASVHAGIPPRADTPQTRHPPPRPGTPWSRHPPDQAPRGSRPPGSKCTPPRPGTPWEQTPLQADPPEQTPPQTRHSPGADPPWEQTHPPVGADTPPTLPVSRHPPPGSRLQHTVNERPVRILLECILFFIQNTVPSSSVDPFAFSQASLGQFSGRCKLLYVR